jgi:carbamoyl-phosphate synthase large subunit
MKSILVSGVGGVVGQGILRNLTDLALGMKIIGTNVVQVSAGNYLCDKVFEVPFANHAGYIPRMIEICKAENVALIIPSTDYEVYYLSEQRQLFPCPIAVPDPEVTKLCLDKFLNYQAFERHHIPFAKSFLPSGFKGQFKEVVVKPREGRGSRNIYMKPPEPTRFDDSYVVQELLEGPEITSTFYVKRTGELLGFITFLRELESGNTTKAEVTFDYDVELEKIIRLMLKYYPFRGSCNIQSKVTKNGIVPFEINCRVSGTNSIRSQFGFTDVSYLVQEYLLEEKLEKPVITKGSALRVILDIIYPEKTLTEIESKTDKFYIH